jgi:hypothetical protein
LGLVSPLDFEYSYNQKTYENAAWLCVYKKQERSAEEFVEKINNRQMDNNNSFKIVFFKFKILIGW